GGRRLPQQGGRVPADARRAGAAGAAGGIPARPSCPGERGGRIPHCGRRQPAPSGARAAAPAAGLDRGAVAPVAVRHAAHCRCHSALGRGARRPRGTAAMSGKPQRPGVAPPRLIGGLAVAALLAFALSLAIGPSGFGLGGAGEAADLIFWEIRMPRAVLGALVGAALGLSGAALQGYLRNPLAEPSLVGVSGGAALGAVLAIHLGLSQT